MLTTAKRYLTTILGMCGVAIFLTAGLIYVSNRTVASLVETTMKEKGERFAQLLLDSDATVDAFLTGVSRDPDAEVKIRGIAALSNIDSFAVFDSTGSDVYRSRSERYAWLLRDRPGGITSGDRLGEAVLAKPGNDWQIVYDDGKSNPSVVAPLVREGRRIGYVQVASDMTSDRKTYTDVVRKTFVIVLLLLAFGTAVPLLVYVRRQRLMTQADERIQFLANYDPLTRVLNRSRMHVEIDRVLATSRATREAMALFYIDVHRLCDINDSLGQEQGDTLLRVIAERIESVVERTDIIGRLGADDFAVLQRLGNSKETVDQLAAKIVEAVAEPLQLAGQTIKPKISIGVAMMPKDGRNAEMLLKHAELALFHHKASRLGDCVLFEPFMDEEMNRRRQIENKIRGAVENGGFELFYQPIVNRNGKSLHGFETLIRLPDGEGGYISPAVFIPIAEARGYIVEIGNWVIRNAMLQAAQWPDDLVIAINLSPVQFRDNTLVGIVAEALADAGIHGRRIEIEVVESLLLDHNTDILGQLECLKALGVSISMDDFGTGYSSLGYLWRFPFDKLKIDQSFMLAMATGQANVREIVATIITLGHHLHMKITAEGVETKEQAELLDLLGCDQIQGYHYGKPMPADHIEREFMPRYHIDAEATRVSRRQIALPKLADVA